MESQKLLKPLKNKSNSPFIRIREKNAKIKALQESLSVIANLVGSQPIEVDIVQAVVELQSLRPSLMASIEENEDMRRNMGATIASEVERHTFNLQLENNKLKDKVASLEKILDNKVRKPMNQLNSKGFWDFIYKVFKLN